jgi:phosphoesterase RecJ-like protein
MVHIMSRLDGIKIWTSIYYDETKKNWKGSIRSISQYDVSKIAKKYHGGGHKNASGYYLTSKKQFPLVIQDIKNLLK